MPEKDYESEQRSLLKTILICFVIVVSVLFIVMTSKISEITETTEAFKNSEVLVCHDTLIVSDSNWKIVDNHLINNNSAGYLLIDHCKIKKD